MPSVSSVLKAELPVLPSRLLTWGRCEMSNGWVLFAYIVVYGFMIGYTAFLVMRWRSVRNKVEN